MKFYSILDVKDHLKNKEKILNRISNVGGELPTEGNPISRSDYRHRDQRDQWNSFLSQGNFLSGGTEGLLTPWFSFALSERDRERYGELIYKKFDPLPRVSKLRSKLDIVDTWFNQYEPHSESEHPIHCHWAPDTHNNLTNIYYVELEDNSLTTIVTDPITHEEFVPPVKEGQILTFDATIWHRSPKNNTDSRKTVISFNTNFL
tara:strand:+ start:819 stop:1430 length:612 start_codon:yes stop_codon:yes gene_type:complete